MRKYTVSEPIRRCLRCGDVLPPWWNELCEPCLYRKRHWWAEIGIVFGEFYRRIVG